MPTPKILFLGANGHDTTRLQLGAEVRDIRRELTATGVGEAFSLVAELAVRPSDLQSLLLSHSPQVLHFSGHGSKRPGTPPPTGGAITRGASREFLPVEQNGLEGVRGGLLLEDSRGSSVHLRPDVLLALLSILKRDMSLRCVVLNACFTAEQAEAIAEHVDCVVGTAREIDDDSALAFTIAFYRAIAHGKSVGDAFALGRVEIGLRGLPGEDVPQLFCRRGVVADSIFVVEKALARDVNARFGAALEVAEALSEGCKRISIVPKDSRDTIAHAPTDRIVFNAPAPFRVPFLRNPSFVGRDDDLARLHDLLQKSVAVGVRPAALTGMGGIGKTQLAVEYAYRYANAYPGGVYWVNAAEPLQTEFARLALEEGLSAGDAFESERQRRLALAFAKHLSERPRALAIFDNVEDPLALRNPGPGFIPAQLGCRLLFTTRRQGLRADFESVEVRVLPPQAAFELLLSTDARRDLLTGGSAPERAEASMICRMLGHLPLAITLAAAYLDQNPEIALGEYRGRLTREGALATIDDSEVDALALPTRHDAAVGATLRLQWRALEGTARKNQDARLLMTAASLLGEAALVPRVRLGLFTGLREKPEAGHPARLGSALRALRDLSLVEELSEHEIRLHPLVREFAEQQIEAKDTFAAECAARLGEALWDMGRLHEEVGARGIGAVLEDLWIGHTLARASGQARIAALYRPLARESHALSQWDPASYHGFFLQQLRNRCLNLAITEVMERAEAKLEQMRWPWLRERVPTNRESAALVRTLEGHTEGVVGIAVTVDGRVAVSASSDTTLKVWDLGTGQALRTLEGHKDRVTGVALTAGGRIAVSSSSDTTLKVWDLGTGQALRTLEGHKDRVTGVALTADGRFAVSASWDKVLKVWDLGTGQTLRTLKGHEAGVAGVAVTSDGRFAVSASDDTTLRVWNLDTGQAVHALKGHTSWVTGVVLTADGRFALSTAQDKTLKMWDLDTGREVRSLEGSRDWVQAAALTADGCSCVSSAPDDFTLTVWDLRTGRAIGLLEGHTGAVRGVAVTPDGRFAVSASDDKTLKIWDLGTSSASRIRSALRVVVRMDDRSAISDSIGRVKTVVDFGAGRATRPLYGHTDVVKGVVVTADGRFIVSASHDTRQKVRGLGTGQAIRAVEGNTGWVTDVAAMVDRPLARSTSDDEMLTAWDIRAGNASLAPEENPIEFDYDERTAFDHDQSFTLAHAQKWHTRPVLSVALTADDRFAISASADGTVNVWDLSGGRVVRTLRIADRPDGIPRSHGLIPDTLRCLAVTADGRFAISASLRDHTLRVWGLDTGKTVNFLDGHTEPVLSVAVTADGRFAVSASEDRTLKVWDLGTGEMVLSLEGHSAPVFSVALTADGRSALSASRDHTLKMWDLGLGREVRSLQEPTVAVAMTADGRIAVTASGDDTLSVWDLYTGQKVRALQGHTLGATCVTITADGSFVVSASKDKRLMLWDIGTGKPVMTLESATSLTCCAITQDAKTILAGDEAGALHILDWLHA